jgi:flagellar hook-length control protein FliK
MDSWHVACGIPEATIQNVRDITMEPTLNTAPSPPSAGAKASPAPTTSSSQPSDNKAEFPHLLTGALGAEASRGEPEAPAPRASAVAASQPGLPPGGKGLPPGGVLGLPSDIAVGDGRDDPAEDVGEDGGDWLLTWANALAVDTMPIGPPPRGAPSLGEGFVGSFSGGAGGSGAAEQDDAMNPLLLASAMRQGGDNKAVEPRDPSQFLALAAVAGGTQGGDGAGDGASAATGRAQFLAHPLGQSLDQPLGQPGWGRELGSRMLWLAKDNQQYAELRLNPPHLGPLEVRISLQQDQGANISFLSNHAAVRGAIESALPQLREMFADGGFTLLDVNIAHHSASGGHSGTPGGEGFGSRAKRAQELAGTVDIEAEGQRRLPPLRGAGLVDYFV